MTGELCVFPFGDLTKTAARMAAITSEADLFMHRAALIRSLEIAIDNLRTYVDEFLAVLPEDIRIDSAPRLQAELDRATKLLAFLKTRRLNS